MKEPTVLQPPTASEWSWQQQLLDRSPALMFAKDLEGRYLYVNSQFQKMFGIKIQDILGKTDEEIFPAKQAEAFRSNDRKVLESGAPIEFEEIAHYVDGTHTSIVYKFPLRDATEQIYGVGGIATDITDRKRAQESLAASEQRFRDAYEKAAVGMSMTDLKGRFLQVNKTYSRITGYSEEELCQTDFLSITHPGDRARNTTLIRQLLQGEIPNYVIEKRFLKKDGTVVWVRNSVSLLRDDKGEPATLMALVEDISRRRQSEERLRENEERFRLMIEAVKDYAIFMLDAEGNIVSWNEGAKRIKGYSSEEIIGTHCSVFHLEEEQRAGTAMSHLLHAKQHGRWEGEGWRVRKDGSRFWADVVITALKDEEGNLRGFAKITRDRTEQRESELRLEHHRQMLAQAEQMARLGSWEWNVGENKVIWSEELYRIYGITRDEFDGTYEGFLKYVHPDDRDLVKRSVEQALTHGETFSYDERIVRPDGEIRTLATQGMILMDENGRPERLVGGCLDITSVRLVEQKLRESHRQLRALAAHLQNVREEERSHISREIHDDLGQALTAVKMDLTIAMETLSLKRKIDKRQLRKEIRSMLSIVNNSIETVRSIASELRPSVLDHLGFVAAVEWFAEQYEGRTGIRCEVNRFAKRITIERERALSIFRIVQEALTNVARHAEATRVKISLKKDGGNLVIHIADNGRGIKLEEQESIRSLGILGMKERAVLLDGNLSVRGSRRGTEVLLEVPVKNEGPQD